MQILVTGGAGFIGSHVVGPLLADGHEVLVLDNLSTGRRSNLDWVADEVALIEADIRELRLIQGAARNCDAILHLAAVPSVPRSISDPLTSHTVNADGTLNVLIAARDAGVRRVVFSSSSSVYGAARGLPKRESVKPEPSSPYAVSKLAAESYCHSFYEVFGLETVALRYFNVFGPRQDPHSPYAAVIPRFIWSYRHGESPVIFGDGEQSRDFTYVQNVVDANLRALSAEGVGGRVYNIACGERISLNRLAEAVRAQIGTEVEAVHGPSRPGDVRHSLADIGRERRELGYEPSVPLEEGLRRTVDWALAWRDVPEKEPVLRAQRGAVRIRISETPAGSRLRASRIRLSHQRRYLITGGAGFIGSHLADALLTWPHCERLTLLDDLSVGDLAHVQQLRDARTEFVRGSVADTELVDALMRGADVCIHLASAVGVQRIVNDPVETMISSVRGSNVVMRAASENGVRLLFGSTSEVYGKHANGALTEQDDLILGSPAKARWTYAIAKSYGEALLTGYHRRDGLDGTVVRLFNTVGPRQMGSYGMVLPRFVSQALRGEDLTVYGSGAQTRCFTHVKDTVAAILALTDCEQARGGTFNVGTSTPVTIVELARLVIERSGSSSGIVFLPYGEAYGEGFEELGQRQPDTTALRNLTRWRPHYSVEDAIDDVVAYERQRLAKEAPIHRAVSVNAA